MVRASAFMHIPSPALGACILAGVERDTRNCMLEDAERFNYYPATPMAVISWIFEGTLHMVEEHGSRPKQKIGPALPRMVISGPQRSHSISWSPGPVHALSVGFYPDALSRLIGVSIESYIDQHLPLEAVAPLVLLQACEGVLNSEDDLPFKALEANFQALWQEKARASPAPFLSDWVRAIATLAAHSTAGRSLRQLQRKIRDWTGQSYRDLQFFIRVEEAFLCSIGRPNNKAHDLADIAANAGFADQSHMGRKIRQVTGMSPARFSDRLIEDEAFWYYRLMAGELRRVNTNQPKRIDDQ